MSLSSLPMASLSLHSCTSVGIKSRISVKISSNSSSRSSSSLRSSFLSTSASLSFPSSFSGLSLGIDLRASAPIREKPRRLVITAAGRQLLCMTKRNRSGKSLAHTHGFRRRMRTTSGRALLQRRRAKGRKILCTKSHPNRSK